MGNYWLPSASSVLRSARAAGQFAGSIAADGVLEALWAHLDQPLQPLWAVRQLLRSSRILHCPGHTLSDPVQGELPSSWTIPGGYPLIQLAAEGMWFALRPLHEASPKVKSSWSAWLSVLGHVYVQMGKVEIPSHLHCGFCQTYWNYFSSTSPVVQSHS